MWKKSHKNVAVAGESNDIPLSGKASNLFYRFLRVHAHLWWEEWAHMPKRVVVITFVQLAVLAGSWYFGTVHPLTVSARLAEFTTTLGLLLLVPLIFGWFLQYSPIALWDMPEAEWFLMLPVPATLILGSATLRQLRSLKGFGFVLLIIMLIGVGSLHLTLLTAVIGMIAVLYEALVCALLALFSVLILAHIMGKRHMRRIIVGIALMLCFIPFLLLVSATQMFTAYWLGTLQTLFMQTTSPWSPLQFFVQLLIETGGFHPDTAVGRTTVSNYSVIGILLGLPLLLWFVCIGVTRRGFQTGWESLHSSLDSFHITSSDHSHLQKAKKPLTGSFLWEFAWKIPFIAPTWSGIIGFCWQDALYDWKRLSSIMISAVLLALAFVRVSFVDLLASSAILTILMSVDAFFVRALGLPLLKRMFLAKAQLAVVPLRARDTLGACLLAVALPLLLFNILVSVIAFLLAHLALDQALFTLVNILVGGGLLSVIGTLGGAFAIDNRTDAEGRGMRFGASVFFLGGLGVFLSTEIPVGLATFKVMKPEQQRVVVHLLSYMFHLNLIATNVEAILVGVLGTTCLLIIVLSINSWRQVRRALQ